MAPFLALILSNFVSSLPVKKLLKYLATPAAHCAVVGALILIVLPFLQTSCLLAFSTFFDRIVSSTILSSTSSFTRPL